MRRLARRFGWFLAALVVVVAVAPAALAADPPAGVAYDASVTVLTRVMADDGSPSDLPVAEATVTLVTTLDALPDDPLQVLTGTSDEAGAVTFDGVARPESGGPAIELAVDAYRSTVTVNDGCVVTETWYSLPATAPAAPTVELSVAMDQQTTVDCPTESAEPVPADPTGLAFDATLRVTVSRDGQPADAALFGTTERADWSAPISGEAVDGLGFISDVARPDDGGPPVHATILATTSGLAAVHGCAYSLDLLGQGEVDVDGAGEFAVAIALEPSDEPAPADGDPVLAVSIIDADGAPVAGADLFVGQVAADGSTWHCQATAGSDGTALAPLLPWGEAGEPSSISLQVRGPVMSVVTDDKGCDHSFGPTGEVSLDLALAGGDDPAPTTIETAMAELSAVCSTTGAPAPEAPGGEAEAPTITLPPTDARPAGVEAGPIAPARPLLAIGLLLAVAGIGSLQLARRSRARPR